MLFAVAVCVKKKKNRLAILTIGEHFARSLRHCTMRFWRLADSVLTQHVLDLDEPAPSCSVETTSSTTAGAAKTPIFYNLSIGRRPPVVCDALNSRPF